MHPYEILLQARDTSVEGMPFNIMMQYMPLPEEMKLEMFKELLPCCMPIFNDRTVLIFMLLLAIFDQEGDRSIMNIKESLLAILTRYLKEKTKSDASLDLQNIIKCVETLPRLLRIFLDMKELQEQKLQEKVQVARYYPTLF